MKEEKRTLRAIFLTAGTDMVASSRTRVYQYMPYFEKEGIFCRAMSHNSPRFCRHISEGKDRNLIIRLMNKIYGWARILQLILLARHYDILFIQRVLLPVSVQKLLSRQSRRIIFDFDDALYLNSKKSFLRRFNSIVSISSYVILENDTTKEYALKFNPNVIRITGPIQTARYVPANRPVQDKVTLGWIGSPATAGCLDTLKNVFSELLKKYPELNIVLIGAPDMAGKVERLITKKWSLDTEVSDLQEFDIGIMPLVDTPWSRGKGGYKILQYMSLGIPSVASSVGINSEIIRDGVTGFIVNNRWEEWLEKLSILIEEPSLRRRMGEEARNDARKRYSFEASLPIMLGVLKREGACP